MIRKLFIFLAVLSGLATPVYAQTPTIVQCKSDAAQALIATSSWKVNLPNPSIAGNTITAAVVIGNSTTTVTVTDDKSNTWNNATKIADGGNNTGLQMAYTSGGVTAGTQQITITYSVARTFNQVQICEWYNVATSTPLDAQTGRATSSTTITTAAFSTAADGDLIICSTFLDNFTKPAAPMSWTAGTVTNVTTPVMATVDNASYMATQYGVQATHVSTTATIVTSLSPTGNGAVIACIALKAGTSGGDLAAGIRVRGIEVQSLENSTAYANYSGTSFTFQVPVRGNLVALGWTGRPTNEPTTVTSSPSLSWAHCLASSDSGGSGNAVWWWYAKNATPNTLYTFTISGFGSTPSASIQNFIDISGAAVSPFDTCASANGSDTSGSPVTGPSLTPATANGLVLSVNQEDRNTITGASPGSFQATDVAAYSGSSGDTDEGLALYYNPTKSSTAVTWTYSSYEGGAAGPGAWATQSISLKAAGDVVAQASSGYQASSSSYTFSINCTGSNRFLIVGVSMVSVGGSSVSGITHNSVALTKIGSQASVSGAVRIELWGLLAPATGAQTIAVTLSASLDSATGAVCMQNVNQTLPYEAFTSAQATNVGAADATVTVTTVADNDVVFGVVASDDTSITTPNPGIEQWNTTGTLGSGSGQTIGPVTPAGGQAVVWSSVGAAATWSIGGVGIRNTSASGGGSTSKARTMTLGIGD